MSRFKVERIECVPKIVYQFAVVGPDGVEEGVRFGCAAGSPSPDTIRRRSRATVS